MREPLAGTDTDGYRLVHGENDGLPGLVVDRYAATLVVKLYTTAWLPWLDLLLDVLGEVQPANTTVLRLSREVAAAGTELYGLTDGGTLRGALPDDRVRFRENGLVFAADVVHGQKTGFFLDQRDNRARVRRLARGKRTLNVFAYSGGFSVYAAAGGAPEVVSIDLSAAALADAALNFQLNRSIPSVAACRHQTLAGDAFQELADLGRAGRGSTWSSSIRRRLQSARAKRRARCSRTAGWRNSARRHAAGRHRGPGVMLEPGAGGRFLCCGF